MTETSSPGTKQRLLAAALAGCLLATPALATEPTAPAAVPAPAKAAPAPARAARTAGPRKTSPYRPRTVPDSAKIYYAAAWGVDRLKVSSTASGNLIRFSYRVVDPAAAKVLADRGATPYLYGQRSHAMLQIPVMEKVGPLRQSGSATPGKEYWMTFSNKGHLVKPGDQVDVAIGNFRAQGLVVE